MSGGTVLEQWTGHRDGHGVVQTIRVALDENTASYHVSHTDSYHFDTYEAAKEFAERTRQRSEKSGRLKLQRSDTSSGE